MALTFMVLVEEIINLPEGKETRKKSKKIQHIFYFRQSHPALNKETEAST